MAFESPSSALIRAGLEGVERSVVEGAGPGELVRAVVPVRSARDGAARSTGVVVVNRFLPRAIGDARRRRSARATPAYDRLQPQQGHVRGQHADAARDDHAVERAVLVVDRLPAGEAGDRADRAARLRDRGGRRRQSRRAGRAGRARRDRGSWSTASTAWRRTCRATARTSSGGARRWRSSCARRRGRDLARRRLRRSRTINPPALRLLGVAAGRVGRQEARRDAGRPALRDAVGAAAPPGVGPARDAAPPDAGRRRGRGADAQLDRLAHARRERRRGRLRGRRRRRDRDHARAAHGRLARDGAAHRARDQEPADPDPALRAAPAPQAEPASSPTPSPRRCCARSPTRSPPRSRR